MLAHLWWLWELCSLVAFGGTVARLGSDSFDARETATAELRAAGWLAYPACGRATTHADPEVAGRAERIIRPLDDFRHGIRALWVFASPEEPDYAALFLDHALRYRMHRLDPGYFGWISPDRDPGAFECWMLDLRDPSERFTKELRFTRELFHPSWRIAPQPKTVGEKEK